MATRSRLVFASCCLLAASITVARVVSRRPARRQSPVTPAQGKVDAASSKDQAVAVKELDEVAFKKLLQRDAGADHPLLITFWATWCEPCREEFPDLVRIDDEYRQRGLDYVTISLDDVADINKGVPQYLSKIHARMPAYLLNVAEPDTIIAAVDPKWGGELPATFMYDPHGQMVFKHFGKVKPDELRVAIEKQVQAKQ
jgi:thiol-disulfide isomerase/thioredoxin